MHIALSVSARRHQRLDHTGETYLVGGTPEFVIRLGVEIFRRAQPQFLGGKVANGTAVHGIVHCLGTGHHLHPLPLIVEKAFGAYGLYLRHNDVGAVLAHHGIEGLAVEHGEHLALVGHLHGRCPLISVASHHILSRPLGGNDKFLAQFA